MNKIALCLVAAGSLMLSTLSGCASTKTKTLAETPPARENAVPLQSAAADSVQQARTYEEVEKRARLKNFWFP